MNKQRDDLQNVPVTELLYRKSAACLYPLSTTFELSPVCNFNCKMCYVRKSQQEVDQSPRPPLACSDFLRIAKEALDAGCLYLLLTGGEPFLWPDFWPLYDTLIDMGFLVSVNTNGSLIDEAAVEKLRKRPPKQINITLYGSGDETYFSLCGAKGVYQKVDRAITMLADAGICVKLNCSLTPQNEPDLDAMMTYAEQKHLRMDVSTYMFPPIRKSETLVGENAARLTAEQSARYRLYVYHRQAGDAAYRRFLEEICAGSVPPPGLDEHCVDPIDGKIRCRAGRASSWITWDGYMTPCGLMTHPRADIKQQSFSEAWNRITAMSADLRLSSVCDSCANQNICHPCAAMALAETGRVGGIPTYLCRTTNALRALAKSELDEIKKEDFQIKEK